MNAFSRSWKLLQATWSVLQAEKSLALYPILAVLLVLLISLVVFGGGFALLYTHPEWAEALEVAAQSSEQGGTYPLWMLVAGLAGLFVYYLTTYLITYYFMTGLAGAALMRFDGEDPTLGDGLSIASSRITVIFGFALIAATVGVLLAMLRGNQNRGVGGGLAMLGGFAWNVASFLVIPMIAAKEVGPIDALKESMSLLRKTWGEQLIGTAGLGLVFGLLMVLVVLGTGGVVGLVVKLNQPILVMAVGALGVILFVVLAILSSTLTAIYRAALYRYAAVGAVSEQFDQALISDAFKPKWHSNFYRMFPHGRDALSCLWFQSSSCATVRTGTVGAANRYGSAGWLQAYVPQARRRLVGKMQSVPDNERRRLRACCVVRNGSGPQTRSGSGRGRWLPGAADALDLHEQALCLLCLYRRTGTYR